MLALVAAQPVAAIASTTKADDDCVALNPGAPPRSDLPTPAQRKALKGCDAEAIYYGIGQPADPVRGRLCAFTEPDAYRSGFIRGSRVISGDILLMMIYANGIGARRNIPYALQLGCETGDDDGRMTELRSLGKRRDFSWCDQALDNQSAYYCGEHDDRIAVWKWQRQLNALALTLPARARASFAALRIAQSAWAEARSKNEEDQTGSDRWEIVMLERRLQDDDFLQMVRQLQTGRPPRLGLAQLNVATARMQHGLQGVMSLPAAYDRARHAFEMALQKSGAGMFWTTITPEGIQATQQAWLRYREAWGSFAARAYPRWGRNDAEAWVTMKRADMLEDLLARQEPQAWQQDPVLMRQHWLLVRQNRATALSRTP